MIETIGPARSNRLSALFLLLAALVVTGCGQPGSGHSDLANLASPAQPPGCDDLPAIGGPSTAPGASPSSNPHSDMPKSDAEWRDKLTPMQYRVLRQEGTEPAGTGEYLHHTDDGVYRCAGCGAPLYDSTTKFPDNGWPSFTDAIPGSVATRDVGYNTREVHCANCGGHLGHIFMDGPGPRRTRH